MEKVLAMYIRISLEDDDLRMDKGKSESDSISNQRELLKRYILEKEEFNGYQVKEFFDDGYTGRNFERPSFQNMIEECRKDKIACIMVKDLSRLGRNYVEVGNLLEQVFPFLGVRVVSVNDCYDSNLFIGQTGGIDVAFKNLIYNLYSRDLSKKVKTAFETRMKRGEYVGTFGIFGYKKSPDDIHKLLVDEEAAAIVRRIFRMVISGMQRKDIVRTLNEEHVLTPALYRKKAGCSRDWYPDGKKGGWNSSMIAKIIRDERYAGHMVSHKRIYENFESRHQIDLDKSEWIVVRNTHEGIVSQDEFDKANASMRSVVQGKRDNAANHINYSVIVCPHCGLRLRPGKRRENYMHCPTGRHHKDSICSSVRIRRDVAEDTLVRLVRQQAELLLDAEKKLKEKRMQESAHMKLDEKQLWAELKKLENDKIADYESYKVGNLTRAQFIEKKGIMDIKKKGLSSALSECEVQNILADAEHRQYAEAFQVKEYACLEVFDKVVMASFISTAKVIGEDCLEVTWKHQDIFKKIVTNS